jgi:hypothetical protein
MPWNSPLNGPFGSTPFLSMLGGSSLHDGRGIALGEGPEPLVDRWVDRGTTLLVERHRNHAREFITRVGWTATIANIGGGGKTGRT